MIRILRIRNTALKSRPVETELNDSWPAMSDGPDANLLSETVLQSLCAVSVRLQL